MPPRREAIASRRRAAGHRIATHQWFSAARRAEDFQILARRADGGTGSRCRNDALWLGWVGWVGGREVSKERRS